jgi:hypothetical protein
MYPKNTRHRPITHSLKCASLIVILLVHATGHNQPRALQKAENLPRHLIICVDGIGFSLIEKMMAENKFSDFHKPGRMIAPFPTLTNISMTDIMSPHNVSLANGYEDSYYDVAANKMRGSLLDRFRQKSFIQNSFRELFDYHPSALKSGIGYAAPPVSTYLEALTDLVRLKQKFNASKQPVFYAYLGATDSLAHLGGKSLVSSYLVKLDNLLRELRRRHGANLTVTIFSDHGNDFRDYKRVDLKSALRSGGFKMGKRKADNRSVVIPQFGLIGCAVVFTAQGKELEVASTLRAVGGVDFVSFADGDIVHIVSSNGEATIERRGTRYRYTAKQGDPLELMSAIGKISKEKKDSDGFQEDKDWFAATTSLARPDAVRRVFEGTTNSVRNRASLLVSFKDGYYAGSRTLDIFAFLQATHGNIGREQSLGFIISTKREVPEYTRAADVWATIGSPDLTQAHKLIQHREVK